MEVTPAGLGQWKDIPSDVDGHDKNSQFRQDGCCYGPVCSVSRNQQEVETEIGDSAYQHAAEDQSLMMSGVERLVLPRIEKHEHQVQQ